MWTFRPSERRAAGMAPCGEEVSDGGEAEVFGDEDDMVKAWDAKVAWEWQMAGWQVQACN